MVDPHMPASFFSFILRTRQLSASGFMTTSLFSSHTWLKSSRPNAYRMPTLLPPGESKIRRISYENEFRVR